MIERKRNSRLRTLAMLNLAVWAMIVFTVVLLDIWIKPNSGFHLMGLLMGSCFTIVSVIDFFSRD